VKTSPKISFRILIFSAAATALTACAGMKSGRPDDAPPLRTVERVDLQRYAGLWYEIARYPTSFQRNCEGVTAEYSLRPDGRVGVVNTCRAGTATGAPRRARGVATVIEGSNNAKIAVNFAPIPLPKGQGNYWVIDLDPAYRTAVVASPSGDALWFLSRTPTVTPDQRARMEAAARDQGFDLRMLKETLQ
jgi:apolipoprotein D and lipocalin family protein